MWRIAWTALAVVLIAPNLADAQRDSAATANEPPFTFADAGPVSLGWSALREHPVDVEVLNNGTQPRFLRASLSDLGLASRGGQGSVERRGDSSGDFRK